jgi:glycosyltransferase involved in cell wall biosynthesis
VISAIPRSILVLCSQVPFTRGGAEVLTDGLVRELRSRNFEVDVVGLPFSAQPKSQLLRNIALWRGLPLSNFAGRDVDMVICTKFPTYAVHHPRKVLWLIHQHRQMYDLYGTRFGDFSADSEDEALRQLVMDADRQMLLECEKRFTISGNVTKRLSRYLGLESEVLEPPLPLGDRYRQSDSTQPYLLSVGRLCSIKRVDLIIKALPQIDERISLKIVGSADEPQFQDYLESEVQKHQLWHRVSFLGRVADEELLTLFAEATATVYTPFDEDYGFVTLEALQSGTPVITTVDSGAVLSFVQHEQNGLVAEPTESGLAAAVNRLVQDEQLSEKIRANARQRRERSTWDMVIDKLTSPATAVDQRSPAIENG